MDSAMGSQGAVSNREKTEKSKLPSHFPNVELTSASEETNPFNQCQNYPNQNEEKRQLIQVKFNLQKKTPLQWQQIERAPAAIQNYIWEKNRQSE